MKRLGTLFLMVSLALFSIGCGGGETEVEDDAVDLMPATPKTNEVAADATIEEDTMDTDTATEDATTDTDTDTP